MPALKKIEYSDMKFEDHNLNDINLNVLRLSNIYRDRGNCDIETLKQEDSNSGSSLQIASQINDIYNQTNSGSNPNTLEDSNNLQNDESNISSHMNEIVKQNASKHLFESHNDESLIVLSHSKNWYYCEICGLSYSNKSEFENHYDTHFYKCKVCLAVFATTEILEAHCKEIHYNSEQSDNSEVNNKTVTYSFF